MKKKALKKDFRMEIKKTRGRFLSILFIVALGVAFFSGIRASEPDMRLSGDAYLDRQNFYDGQIISTMGLTKKDEEAIKNVKGVKETEASYTTDAICTVEDNQKVLHLISIPEHMNTITVTQGRLPETKEECLLDDAFIQKTNYKIGDMIQFESGSEDPLGDTLAVENYKIVGIGNSPLYISYTRGSSTIGTGEVSGFAYLTKEAFLQDYYTSIYYTVEGTKEKTAFTKEYDQTVAAVQKKVEALEAAQCRQRQMDLQADAGEELEDAKKELADAKKEAEEKLTDAQEQLEDGKQKLSDAKQEIEDGKTALSEGRKKIEDSKKQVEEGKEALSEGWQTLVDKQSQLDAGKAQYETGLAQYQEQETKFTQSEAQYEAEYAKQNPMLQQGEEELTKAKSQLEQQKEQYEALLLTTPAENLLPMKTQLEEAEKEITNKEQELEAGKKQLADAKTAIDAGREQLVQAKVTLDQTSVQLQSAQEQINQGWETWHQQEKKLQDAESQISESEETMKEKEQELSDGEKEIQENEATLEQSQKDYEEAKAEADKEIKDAEEKIADGEKEISEIDLPEWYSSNRNDSLDYKGYGENADRMSAIGKVFPLLFFLVAALISLTSMTRMVEEQRTQIGTLKALGYGKVSIMGKYLKYAFSATLLGSIIGVLLGEKILPYIIVYAYKIMYKSIPDIIVPYEIKYACMAALAAVFCTTAATLLSCYRELAAQPAVLMRPPAPKNGKRILLERLPFLWRHLNFTWKATMRNLIRYKKRFFMTLFGIGGCMALMLVGFGLKDSIFEIAVLQYEELQLYDASIYLKDKTEPEQKEQLERYLADEKQVKATTEMYMKKETISGLEGTMEVYISVPKDVENISKFVIFRSRTSKEVYDLKEDEIILTEKAAKIVGASVGDSIQIGKNGEEKMEVTIGAICENYMSHYLYMTPKIYEELYGKEPEYNSILMENGTINEEELLEIGKHILENDGVLNVSYTNSVRDQLDDMLGSLNIVIVVLIVSAGMLAFVVLYNLNTVNIAERRRELATIKVLGFYDLEVAEYVYRENILLTLLGCVLGVGLGKVLHRFIIVTVEIENAMFGRDIDLSSFLYSILFTIAFSLFVNLVMFYKLRKIDMVESLKSVE